MSTQTFPVTGLTCGHCVSAVTSEVSALPGVKDVEVELVADGTSTLSVTSDQALTDAAVAAALDEAGEYQLVATS
jgi:copper chaperone CopZ